MKLKIKHIAATLAFSAPLLFTACDTGENRELPPESTTGDTQETGVEGSGDLPGTAADDTTDYVNHVIGDDNASAGDSVE